MSPDGEYSFLLLRSFCKCDALCFIVVDPQFPLIAVLFGNVKGLAAGAATGRHCVCVWGGGGLGILVRGWEQGLGKLY